MSKPLLMRLIVLGLACLSATSADAASIHRCYLPGVEDAAHCLTLTVPLDWKKPQGKTITVFAAQFPALSRGANKDPLFILPGGPGQSGDMLMPLVKSAFSDVNKARDLMLIYPRGTARSSPISCPEPPAFEVFNAVHVAKRLKACSAQQKNDPRFFTTDEITRDTNAIREAFGYTKLNIWGGSFGTRLAQHYIAAYPEQVRTVVLDGATKRGQSILLTMPHTLDVAINSVSISCKLDKACAAKGPDMRVTLRELLARLKAHPEKLKIDDPLTHEPVTITLDDNSVIDTLTLALYTPPSRAIIPIMVRMAARGNYQPLIALAAQAGSQLGDESISTGENLSVLCAEDFQQASRKDVEKSTEDSIFGLRNYDLYANACAAWSHRVLGKNVSLPISSNIPALVLSGALDPVTPPPLGAATAAQFKDAVHIVVPASGHGVSGYGCTPKIIAEFINAASMHGVDTACLTKAKPQAPLAGSNG